MPFSITLDPVAVPAKHAVDGAVELQLRAATLQDYLRWERDWKPNLGDSPTASWRWHEHISRALKTDGFLCLAIARDDRAEALASLRLARAESKLVAGRDLVYVEYIGVAPENLPPPRGPRMIGGLGLAMMTAVHSVSTDLSCEGRIGLHSKPESEVVYRRWSFTEGEVERTEDGQWLYFELEPGPFPRPLQEESREPSQP